jgi:hypothetical protein
VPGDVLDRTMGCYRGVLNSPIVSSAEWREQTRVRRNCEDSSSNENAAVALTGDAPGLTRIRNVTLWSDRMPRIGWPARSTSLIALLAQ